MAFWKKKKRQATAKKKINAVSPKTYPSKAKPVPEWKPAISLPTYKPPDKDVGSKTQKKPESETITSSRKSNGRKEFLETFRKLTYRHRAWDIWRDFIIMFACTLSNPVDKSHYNEREERYMKIIKKYNKEEQAIFPELAAQTVLALEENQEQDFLGSIFMELNLGNESGGQFFTPYHVCELMAKIALGNDVVQQVNEQGYITIHDPCCGAGATLIAGLHAARKQLEKENLNYQNHVLVIAQDIDEIVALMCYIQLSLLGIAAYIKVGNTFTEPITDGDSTENYWFTMMYFSDVWTTRRLIQKINELLKGEKI